MCQRGSLGLAEAGEAIRVDRDEATLLAHVEQALASYKTNRYDPNGPPRYTGEEYRELVRSHDAVMILQHDTANLELIPWERFRGNYRPVSAASIVLNPPISAATFADAVQEALRRANC
jgi:hypothetical protein